MKMDEQGLTFTSGKKGESFSHGNLPKMQLRYYLQFICVHQMVYHMSEKNLMMKIYTCTWKELFTDRMLPFLICGKKTHKNVVFA